MDITLFVEHACNLRCTYCYTGAKFKRAMSEEFVEPAIDLALSDAPRHIDLSFFGGEPLLRFPFLKSAVARFRKRLKQTSDSNGSEKRPEPTLRVILNTNLTLLDDEIVAWLSEERAVLTVSLDGPEDIHDRQRRDTGGRGSYAAVARGLECLDRAKLPYRFIGVVTPENAGEMGRMVEEHFRWSPVATTLSPNLSAEWGDGALARFAEGAQGAALAWEQEFRAGRARHLEPFQQKLLTHVHGGGARGGRCGIRLHEITVAPSGHLYACPQQVEEDNSPDARIGHLGTGVDHAAIVRRRTESERIWEVCGKCDLRARCAADCGCRQIASGGRLGNIDGVLCETEAALVDAADEMAERLYADRVPAFLEYLYERNWKLKPGAELIPLRRLSPESTVNGPR